MKISKIRELTTTEIWVNCPYCDKSYSSVKYIHNDYKIKCPNCKEIFEVDPNDENIKWLDVGEFKELKG